MKIKKLFFLSHNQMILTAIDALGKEVGAEFFTLSVEEDSFHFIRDIQPEVVLVDISTVSSETIDKIEEEFSSQIPVVHLVSESKEGERSIPSPLDIESLIPNLESIHRSYHGEG